MREESQSSEKKGKSQPDTGDGSTKVEDKRPRMKRSEFLLHNAHLFKQAASDLNNILRPHFIFSDKTQANYTHHRSVGYSLDGAINVIWQTIPKDPHSLTGRLMYNTDDHYHTTLDNMRNIGKTALKFTRQTDPIAIKTNGYYDKEINEYKRLKHIDADINLAISIFKFIARETANVDVEKFPEARKVHKLAKK